METLSGKRAPVTVMDPRSSMAPDTPTFAVNTLLTTSMVPGCGWRTPLAVFRVKVLPLTCIVPLSL